MMGTSAATVSRRSEGTLDFAGLRILHVIPQESGRKSDFSFAKRQVSSLERFGAENDVFYFYPAKPLLPQWRTLRDEVRTFGAHVLHAHYGTVTATVCAFGMGVPLVVTFRGSDLNPDKSVNRARFTFSRVLSQIAAARAQGIICVTAELKSRLWCRSSKVCISSGGIDTGRYRPMSCADARRQLNWPIERKIVLFNAGSNPQIKRIDLAEDTVAIAKSSVPELEMRVMSGEFDPDLVPVMLNAADCLLVTSDSEGSPYIVKEALACNLPIVSVPVGDVKDRLAGVEPSRVVERDPVSLAEAVVEVVRAGRRSNGRMKVGDITEEAEAARLRDVYLRATGRF